MKNVKFKLGAITSSITLSNYIRKITSDSKHDIRVSSKGLDEALPVGKQMEKDGVEVIISRRGTAHMLRESLNIPVLSVPLSAFDILKCLKMAKSLGSKVLLPCYRYTLSGSEMMEELLGIHVLKGVYQDKTSLEELVHEAKLQGCTVVVGAGIAKRYANKYHLKFVEIETSKDVIDATLESAKSVAQANRLEQLKTERYRTILESASEGMILSDLNNNIVDMNQSAKSLLKIGKPDVIGKPISRFLPKAPINRVLISNEPILDKLERINKELFIFNHKPIFIANKAIGIITTFEDTTKVIQTENEVRRTLSKGLVAKYTIDDLIHVSSKMKEVIEILGQFSTTDTTILITGETGTGKEIVAQSIHNLSKRRINPFVSINCGALPDQLLESELFGYEEGAFTGSKKGGKPGLFEIAHTGTLLLDEITSTSQNVQSNLLRVLQEREVMRIGGIKLTPVDVRIIAISNKDLNREVQEGKFREDLLFRLNVLPIRIPPLRERTEDIPLLLNAFIRQFSIQHNLQPITVPSNCIKQLMNYSWPGNVRQLLNFTERLVLMCRTTFNIAIFDKHIEDLHQYQPVSTDHQGNGKMNSIRHKLIQNHRAFETEMILDALEKCQYNKGKAARLLGISRTTLWKKMKQLDAS
jgi:PAS domain S-box-containing protein